MTLPAKSPTLWVAADGQQGELALALPSLGMPPESIIFPTPADDPYGGTSLDDATPWRPSMKPSRFTSPRSSSLTR